MLDKTDEVTFKDIDVCVEYWSIKVTSLYAASGKNKS
jgi:hypothetical protein